MKRLAPLVLALAAALAAQAPAALTLQQLQQMALARNPTLRQAGDAVRATAGATRQAGLWPNPTVGYQGEQIRGGSFRGGEQGAFVQQTIVLGGKLKTAQEAARARERQQRAWAMAQRQAVLTGVALAYYDALAAQRALGLRQRRLALARDAEATTTQLANVGQANRPEELQASVSAGAAGVALAQAREQARSSWTRLAAMVGDPALPQQPLAGHLSPGPPPLDTAALIAQLLTRSPAVQAAEAAVAAAQANLASAGKQPIPDLELRGGVEDNRELLPDHHAVGAQAFASASIALPLFNRNQGNIATAAAGLDRAREEVTRLRLALRAQAAPVLARYRAAARAEADYQHMLPQAEQAYRLLLADYHAMYAPYSEVLAARQSWLALRSAQIANLRRLWRSAATLRGMLLSAGLQLRAAGEHPAGETMGGTR